MTKYNKYAQDLAAAFKDAREKYSKLFKEYQGAKKFQEHANSDFKEAYLGERERMRLFGKEMVADSVAKLETEGEEIWRAFQTRADEIGKALAEEVARDNVPKAEEVDSACVELLKTGIVDSSAALELVNKHAGNATMLKIIGKYADEKAKDEKTDRGDRGAFFAIAERYKNGAGGETLSGWRDLVEAANHLSGRIRRGETKRDPEYAMAMAAKFEEIAAATIEEF